MRLERAFGVSLQELLLVGAWYELLEWITMVLFCKQAEEVCFEAITQGDIWEAQKDMAYAIIGSMIYGAAKQVTQLFGRIADLKPALRGCTLLAPVIPAVRVKRSEFSTNISIGWKNF